MAPTMRDVAALAGVSVKTVSRVVNLEPHTRPEVVERVRAAIAELDWVPNANARTLRTRRTGLIGIGVTQLRRPYLATLTEALVAEADRHGIQVAVEPNHGDPARVRAFFDACGRIFDGVVQIGPPPPGAVDQQAERDRPVVVVQGGDRARGFDRVDEDVDAAVDLVARHLATMGRGRPVLLGGDRARRTDEDRCRPSAALREAFVASRIDPADVRLVPLDGAADRRAGALAAQQAVLSDPDLDALVCLNDEVALGALAALAAAGLDVPGRIAVVGYDNIDDGRFAAPPLTTVDPRPRHLARAALELLADRLAGGHAREPRAVVLPAELVRRESTLGRAVL